jgi:hypothetical protein
MTGTSFLTPSAHAGVESTSLRASSGTLLVTSTGASVSKSKHQRDAFVLKCDAALDELRTGVQKIERHANSAYDLLRLLNVGDPPPVQLFNHLGCNEQHIRFGLLKGVGHRVKCPRQVGPARCVELRKRHCLFNKYPGRVAGFGQPLGSCSLSLFKAIKGALRFQLLN